MNLFKILFLLIFIFEEDKTKFKIVRFDVKKVKVEVIWLIKMTILAFP